MTTKQLSEVTGKRRQEGSKGKNKNAEKKTQRQRQI
jgi:hypothetical protein